jgi:integrase
MGGYRREKETRAEKVEAEARKARALNDGEIVAVWNACEGRGSFGNVVRLLLLTGARKSEIAKLTRDRILIAKIIRDDILADFIELPPLSTKTGVLHQIPLTAAMRTVIAAQPKTTSAFVFASEVTGKPIQGWTKLVASLQEASSVDFTLHDLRRTGRTLMSRLGVDTDIAELAIGHARKGLEKRYNFDEAWPLRCEAFAKVSKHVAGLLDCAAEKGKVVAIPART